MRRIWAVVSNIVVPGAGLIVLRREWLGFAIALLFCILTQIGVVGLLLIPATVPGVVAWGGLASAAGVWAWSQWLLAGRIRTATGAHVAGELSILRERSAEALASGKYAEARDLLLAGLTINDEDAELNGEWAKLLTRMKQYDEAATAWRRVLYLKPHGPLGRAAVRALSELSMGEA